MWIELLNEQQSGQTCLFALIYMPSKHHLISNNYASRHNAKYADEDVDYPVRG